MSKQTARREFLRFLAASPYVASLGGIAAFLRQGTLAQSAQQASDVISSPKTRSMCLILKRLRTATWLKAIGHS